MGAISMGSRGDTTCHSQGGVVSTPIREPIEPQELGNARLIPEGEFEAGSFQTFELHYIAGKFGIDDSGSIRICFRFASDQTRPQFENPKWANYTTITASNDAVLEFHYDPKGNVRPWDRTLYIKVVRGFLREGDSITVIFGNRSQGSPGMRLQTFVEDSFEFHIMVDPIATFNYQPLPVQPFIKIVAGLPTNYVAVLPTLRKVGQSFALKIKGEDEWGNPSDKCAVTLKLRSTAKIMGLPAMVTLSPGVDAFTLDDLTVSDPGDLVVELIDPKGIIVARSNPMRIVEQTKLLHYWGDLHGQSEESIGTNSARQYFSFARDNAFLDATGHQANDFQITNQFWEEINNLSTEFNVDGDFVVLPGYEWSGNTGLGGDRNVYFSEKGRQIRRSSHALLEDQSDIETDCNSAAELFEAFTAAEEFDVVCYAHCGGRYADVKLAHDGRFEKSMEIHSSWGTFEWLVKDAFEMGYRFGIVANSDGHKGRPGASYPGASLFGAIGGLTCFLMPELTRSALLDCIRKRRHYATTGGHGGRMIISVVAEFEKSGTLYYDDPNIGCAEGIAAKSALIGDIVHLKNGGAEIVVDIVGASPIERVDIFNGTEHLETIRPYTKEELGNRIRVIWEGAEYRGRFRQVIWDGTAQFSDNRIINAAPINFFNRDKTLEKLGSTALKWKALTTGNVGGFDVWVEDPYGGTLKLETPLVKCGVPLEEIGLEDEVFDESGVLPRYLKIFRMPEKNQHTSLKFSRQLNLRKKGDNAIFIRLTQEDGTLAWTSPIYIYR